jgi:putative ABC transport system permease protein
MAWRNLGRNRIRTGLAALGIVIGVVAIATIGMAGAALQQQATSSLGDLANEVTVSPGEDSDTAGITDDQVEEMRRIAGEATVVPQKSNSTVITARNGQEVRVTVTAVTNADAMYNVSEGQSPERLRSGALISENTAERLGLEMGDPVEYNGNLYRIIGFIGADSGGFGGFGGRELVLPMSALSEQEYYGSVTIMASSGDDAETLANNIDAQFNREVRGEEEEILSVQSFASVQEQLRSFFSALRLGLLGIGGISLLVASVAILNVMLMSTIERRGEIGVLRAVGVRRREVLRMILAEAALLGVFGGLAGAVLSLIIGFALFDVLIGDGLLVFQWISSRYLLYGFAFAVFASVLSGVYPAWKAANDRPVESLRA